MLTGYRGIVLALGLILAGAAPPKGQNAGQEQSQAQSEVAKALHGIDTSIQDAAKPDITTQPCRAGQDNRQSDLCAQWKAADAAQTAALAAWLIGGLGVLVGGATLIAAIKAAQYAKKAADHTETGAVAARDAVNETRESNQITRGVQRAWVVVGAELQSTQRNREGIYFRFNIISENVGQTPATHFGLRTAILFEHDGDGPEAARQRAEEVVEGGRFATKVPASVILAPGEREVGQYWETKHPPELTKRVVFGDVAVTNATLVVANYYRTSTAPDVLQVAWRMWLLGSIEDSGDALSTLRIDKDLKAASLHLMPMSGMNHREYPDEPKAG